MDLRDVFDGFIEEAAVSLYPPELSAELLLSEDFRVPYGDEYIPLVEALHRIRVKVAGGGRITKRKFGRKDPRRSMIAKRSARKGRAARMRAMRNPRSKMKRKRTMAARKRMFGGGARRPSHSVRRHAAPRVTRYRR